jgi:hypothetical protein
MNVVMNNGGGFIEVQGTAEGHAFRRHELDALLNLAAGGIARLFQLQPRCARPPEAAAAIVHAAAARGAREFECRQAARILRIAGSSGFELIRQSDLQIAPPGNRH